MVYTYIQIGYLTINFLPEEDTMKKTLAIIGALIAMIPFTSLADNGFEPISPEEEQRLEHCRSIKLAPDGSLSREYLCHCIQWGGAVGMFLPKNGDFTRCLKIGPTTVKVYFVQEERCMSYEVDPAVDDRINPELAANCYQ